jgi:hypothetical protein
MLKALAFTNAFANAQDLWLGDSTTKRYCPGQVHRTSLRTTYGLVESRSLCSTEHCHVPFPTPMAHLHDHLFRQLATYLEYSLSLATSNQCEQARTLGTSAPRERSFAPSGVFIHSV